MLIRGSDLLPYPLPLVYGLIADYSNYSSFFGRYINSIIFLGKNSSNHHLARVHVRHKLFSIKYDCAINFNIKNTIEINGINYDNSDIDYLASKWETNQMSDNSTLVSYFLDFNIKSRIKRMLVYGVIDQSINDKLFYGMRNLLEKQNNN